MLFFVSTGLNCLRNRKKLNLGASKPLVRSGTMSGYVRPTRERVCE